jgi:hypothetical protein
MTYQKRQPTVYIYPENDALHIAIVFRVKPVSRSLLKAIVPKKMYALATTGITENVDLVSIAEASFNKEEVTEKILPYLYMANMFNVSIGTYFDNRVDCLWETRLTSYEDTRPDQI